MTHTLPPTATPIFLIFKKTLFVPDLFFPEADMYWSLDHLLRVPAIAEVMGKSRYQRINQYFDSTEALPKIDPNYDPLFKVRPLLSPFLIGRMFLREPSWKYSAKLVGS